MTSGGESATPRVRWRVCAVLAATALAVGGCTLGKQADSGGGGKSGGGSGGEATQTQRFQIGDEESKAVPIEFPAKSKATVHSSISKLEIDLYQVHRTGRSVTIVFALHNTTAKDMSIIPIGEQLDAQAIVSSGIAHAEDVSLIDGEHLKQYKTFEDENGACLCTVVGALDPTPVNPAVTKIPANTRHYQMAEVAAPPESVDRVTVSIGRLASIPNVKPSE